MGQAKIRNLELFNAGYSYAGITGVIKILTFAHFVSLRLNKVPKDLAICSKIVYTEPQ